MEKKELNEIAQIRFGVNVKSDPFGSVPYLQGKDFDDYGRLIPGERSNVAEEQLNEQDYLRKGDVLFAAKGERNFAVLWKEDAKLVASSTFFVVRVHCDTVLPEYLCWFLMTRRVGAYFNRFIKSATVRTISKKAMSKLEVEIPNQNKQLAIAGLHRLWIKEIELQNQLKLKKEELMFGLNGL